MAKLKITVNKARCISSGDCVETAAAVFQLDNDGKSEVTTPPERPTAPSSRLRADARSRRSRWSTRTPESSSSHRPKSRSRRRGLRALAGLHAAASRRWKEMALRKKLEGRLTIEQTRDLAGVRAMLSGAGMLTDGIEWPPSCYLVAYLGSRGGRSCGSRADARCGADSIGLRGAGDAPAGRRRASSLPPRARRRIPAAPASSICSARAQAATSSVSASPRWKLRGLWPRSAAPR